ncbi:nucleoside 2-deoxyribosyltransferase [Candidatus Pacearchaeota archaeon]|nr:MAG: nucleoside 2-deoxyribosyltransferase [Candidatus Pacearchaeota archaeon]
MDIYFAAAISGGRSLQKEYKKIIEHLKTYGKVLTEHIGSESLTEKGEKNIRSEDIFKRDILWLRKSDVFVCELTVPSFGVGWEVCYAFLLGLPMLGLYMGKKRRISAMVSVPLGKNLFNYSSIEEAYSHIDRFFNRISFKN